MKKLLIIPLILLIFSSIALAENELITNINDISKEIEAGAAAEYTINITNPRDTRDVFRITYNDLDVYPFSDFVRNIVFEPSQLKLGIGESGIIKVILKTVDTAPQDKGYEMPLTVASLTNPEILEEFILKTYVVSPEDVVLIFPESKFAETNNLSDASFVAPYKLTGLTALSVDKAITFFTLLLIAALITFSAPLILVLIHSKGSFSVEGICFMAAA